MNKTPYTLALLLLLQATVITAQVMPSIIPMPNQMALSQGSLDLSGGLTIDAPLEPEWIAILDQFERALSAKGINAKRSNKGVGTAPHVQFMMNLDKTKPSESYQIKVFQSGRVLIAARDHAGAFYAMQTLLQAISDNRLPIMQIEDAPRFAYRGMHLDVARHFFPVAFVKQYIDLLARYKINQFHWHLTDDQGWRIEIKAYPLLQTTAAYRPETLIGHYNTKPQVFDGKRYGGYYTQAEVREIVAYAKARYINVIPEIEMPGHAQAATSAYPNLSCTGQTLEAATLWGVFDDVFCPKEETFTFLQTVLTEVIDLFPSKYIHIGGDECPKVRWKACPNCQRLMQEKGIKDEYALQSYFVGRIDKWLTEHSRNLLGWDEILEGGLAKGATVMSWRGIEGGIAAAQAGHNVIMTPSSHLYFDHYQSTDIGEPVAIGGYLPIEKVYSYEPIPEVLTPEQAKYILGAQANIWTEYMPTPAQVQYMLLPRLTALAEVTWTKPEQKNLKAYIERLQAHFAQWKAEGLNFADKTNDVKAEVISGDGQGPRLRLNTLAQTAPILYQTNKSQEQVYTQEIPLVGQETVTAYTKIKGTKTKEVSIQFTDHLATHATVQLRNTAAKKYSGSGPSSPFNGVNGSDIRFGDAEWLGFNGTDFIAELNFAQAQTISSLSFRFYNAPGQWIYPPTEIEIREKETGNLLTSYIVPQSTDQILRIDLPMQQTLDTLYIKVKNYGTIPEGAQGGGHPAWLFVDEVRVR
jgi:hexosaminidase